MMLLFLLLSLSSLIMITNAFVIVSSFSPSSNVGTDFQRVRMRHKRSLPLPTAYSLFDFDRSSAHRSKVELGMSKINENERIICGENSNEISNDYAKGLIVLATVPMAWGTFEPAVRLVYKYEPLMPPLVFSFAYYLVATSVLSIGKLCSTGIPSSESALMIANVDNRKKKLKESSSKGNGSGIFPELSLSTQGGIELGTYLFIGNAFQVIGLKTVPSDRAAFLLQLTTIFVPLLKRVNGEYLIPLQTWIACLVALMGVALIGLDEGGGLSFNIIDTIRNLDESTQLLYRLPAFSVDDGYIILAAIFYTFHCVRLETYAKSSTSAIGLATAKATTEMIWSGLVILGCISMAGAVGNVPSFVDVAKTSGEKILLYGRGIEHQISSGLNFYSAGGWPTVGLATVWVGTITVAYTIYAQSFGQSKVSAITANLIYSSQPIFTAIVAYFLLGESLGPNGYIGGTLIGMAVLLVIAAENETEEEIIMADAKK